MSHFLHSEVTDEDKLQKIGQSQRKIPGWAWKIIIFVLGVTYSPNDKPSLLFRIIQICTGILAVTFTVTGMVYEIYDIIDKNTKTSLLMGIVTMFLGFLWICMGLYSQRLTARLFSNRNFVECVRLHSRTFLKISVAGLFIFISCGIVGINGYVSFSRFGPESCDTLELHQAVCYVMYCSHISFSVISLIWNGLVGCTLFSVCRTHTIVIRRFISVLDRDTKVLDLLNRENARKFKRTLSTKSMDFISITDTGWFIWDDCSHYQLLEDSPFTEDTQHSSNHVPPDSEQFGGNVEYERCTENKSAVLTNDEILNAYWKISKRMRVTSRYLQRWLGSWIFIICLWISDYIITWLSKKADVFSILECVLPLLLLGLMSSAFAEVNGEGHRMIRCICPITDRLKVLQFLAAQPLQMTVFNFALNYNAIVGVLLAFCIAFASRLILDEIR